jgi:hypothetical protein
MLKHLRIGIVTFALVAAFVPSMVPLPAVAAQSAHSSLELRRYKFHIDEQGRTWVTFRFVNMGGRGVIVNAITVGPHGPWTTIGKRVEPDATFKWSGIIKDRPTAVWLDTDQGVTKFDMVN